MEDTDLSYPPEADSASFLYRSHCRFHLRDTLPISQVGHLHTGLYHVTHISIPFLSQSNSPSDKAGLVVLVQADALTACIPPDLFVKQINQESGFNPDDLLSADAEGIAQLMPDTAAGLGIDPWNLVDILQGAAQLPRRLRQGTGRL